MLPLQGLNEDSLAFQNAISERLGNFVRNVTTCVAGLIVGKFSACIVLLKAKPKQCNLIAIVFCSLLERMGHGAGYRCHHAFPCWSWYGCLSSDGAIEGDEQCLCMCLVSMCCRANQIRVSNIMIVSLYPVDGGQG